MEFQEVVEAEGHLIDSQIMEQIFDKVVEYSGRFEVEQFRIGRTNSDPSYLRLKVEAPDHVGRGPRMLDPGQRLAVAGQVLLDNRRAGHQEG